jgi:type I restriction enzyme, S subunit
MSLGDEPVLPEGWCAARLGDGLIADVQPGFACGAHNRGGDGIAHLRPMNVNVEGKIDLSDVKFVPASEMQRDERWLRPGDVLFNNTNSPELVGKTAFYADNTPRAFSNHMTRIRCRVDGLDPQFCAFLLHHNWQTGYFQSVCNNHVSQASIGREVLLDTSIGLPPLAEQKRIVGKVEALLARVHVAAERLANVSAILERFRRCILSAACDGRLTAGWRDQHATSLGGSEGHHANEEMPDIPVSWEYKRAADVVEPGTIITYGIVLPGPNQVNGVPYIRGQDIDDLGKIHVEQLWKTTPAIAAKHKRSELRQGDVLLCVIRHLRVAIVPSGLDGANLTQGTVRMRPAKTITSGFLARFLASPQAQAWMKTRYIGMAMPRINVEHARAIPIAVPPLTEQHEIVRRVDALFKFADAVERRTSIATARAKKLTQAILAKAFRGELVPTEAELARQEGRSYEPAFVLLERIRAQKVVDVRSDGRSRRTNRRVAGRASRSKPSPAR